MCKVAHPFTKGAVERLVRYVKENFTPGRKFLNCNDLNRKALEWCREKNGRPTKGSGLVPNEEHWEEGTRILTELERPVLLPYLAPVRSLSFDRFVEYEGRRYGVPLPYARKRARMMRSGETLAILDDSDFHELASYAVDWARKDKSCPGQWDYGADKCPEEHPTAPVTGVLRIAEDSADSKSSDLARLSILAQLEKEEQG